MPVWLTILMNDIRDATLEVDVGQIIRPALFLVWLTILVMPLKNIDRRDTYSGLMFVVFLSFCGAILIFALPQHMIPDFEVKVTVISMLAIIAASSARWFLRSELFLDKPIVTGTTQSFSRNQDDEVRE